MKNALFEFLLSIAIAVPIILFVIPPLIEFGNIITTFVAMAFGIWVSGYVIYAIAMLIGALTEKAINGPK